ncbi:response regulator [Sphingomonas sp. BIUV-7]|uniref:Response regulator n=1 Tax=Sphingomonas natans TaxID=3063330 RepID=A0ABT8Y9V7_9SPHN|nr:response regulator [Sphingomonas sp. BIUV-7]MDO6415118.1 response regulator [Sphingomonas sp. BIUV-7]
MAQLDRSRQTILIVEDEAIIRMDLVDFFADSGFDVLEAEGADGAIALMENNPSIAAVVTDIQMPGSMDGVKLSHYLRDRWPPTVLIVTSGAIKPTAADLPQGAIFMPKPFNPRTVLDLLRDARPVI